MGKRGGQRRGPFDRQGWKGGLTGADTFYLAARALAGLDADAAKLAAAQARLRGQDPSIGPFALDLSALHLEGTSFTFGYLVGAVLRFAHLEGASLYNARLEGATLEGAHLEGADLSLAWLGGQIMDYLTELTFIRHWIPDFPERLGPTDVRLAFLSEATTLDNIRLGNAKEGYARVADMRWGGVNLAVVKLPPARLLGDEREARKTHEHVEKALVKTSCRYRHKEVAIV